MVFFVPSFPPYYLFGSVKRIYIFLFNLVHKRSIVCLMRTLFVVALIFWEFSNAFRLTVIAMWIIKTVTLIRRPRPQ